MFCSAKNRNPPAYRIELNALFGELEREIWGQNREIDRVSGAMRVTIESQG